MDLLVCGALRACIVTGDNFNACAVVAQVGDAEPWCFLPFGKVRATRLIAVDERRVLVVATSGEQPDYQMALFDVVARERLGGVFDRNLSADFLFVDRDRTRVTHVTTKVKAWRFPDLAQVVSAALPSMDRIKNNVSERNDGALVIAGPLTNSYSAREARPSLLVVGRDGELLGRFGQVVLKAPESDRRDLLPTPRGRWLWRPHLDSVLATDASGGPLDPADLTEVSDEALLDRLAEIHVHGVLELWRAGPIVFDRRLVTRVAPLLQLVEEASDTPEARLRSARGILDTLRTTLERAPYQDWRPDDPTLRSRMDPMENAVASYYRAGVESTLHGTIVDSDEADETFLVDFGKVRRRVAIDGAADALELSPVREQIWTTGPDPDDPGGLKTVEHPLVGHGRAFLRQISVPTFELPDLGEAACIAAIDAVSDRLAADPQSMVWGSRLTLAFRTPDEKLSEAEFFAHVTKTGPGAVPALRRLLATLDAAPLRSELWSDDMTGALGYAALALIRLDPGAYPCLEGFFTRRDSDHEPFGTKHLLPAVAAATGDFASLDALRFALRRLQEEQLGGCDNGWLLAPAILRGARATCTPAAFAAEALREARAVAAGFDVPYSVFSTGASRIETAREELADVAETAEFAVAAPLLHAADPSLAWDRDFSAIMRRSRIRYPIRPMAWLSTWWRLRRD